MEVNNINNNNNNNDNNKDFLCSNNYTRRSSTVARQTQGIKQSRYRRQCSRRRRIYEDVES